MPPPLPPPTQERTEIYERFCLEYVKDFNGGAAARRAGIENPATSRSWASRALARSEIRARIEELRAAHRKRIQLETEDLIDRLAMIVKGDVRELVEFRRCCCRHCWGAGHRHQFTDNELRMARARHAKDLKKAQAEGRDLTDDIDPIFDEQGGSGFVATNDPNPECPECHGEGHGLPFLRDTRDLSPEAAALFAGIKVTKEGVEIKTHDPVRAIELIGKHLGTFGENLNVKGELTVMALANRMRNRAPLA